MEEQKQKRKTREKIKQKTKEIKTELKKEIKENFFNIPNTLTLARIILAFVVVYMLFSGFHRFVVGAVFLIAALTDALDGILARRLKQTTSIGARLDQVVDRIFTILIVIALAIYFAKNSLIYSGKAILFLILISSREIIGLPGFLIRIVLNKDSYKVKLIGKITTVIQFATITLIIINFKYVFPFIIATSLVGIVSGFDYLRDSVS